MNPHCDKWGCTLRNNFDKLLVLFLIVLLMAYGLHVMHAKDVDDTTLAWVRETLGTALGGLLGLIQGQRQSQDKHFGPTTNTTINADIDPKEIK